jgi:hypothetical protein
MSSRVDESEANISFLNKNVKIIVPNIQKVRILRDSFFDGLTSV